MRRLLRAGGDVLVTLAIMVLGSVGLWVGAPLLWLWIGSQVQGAGASLGAALAVIAAGVLCTIWLLARLLALLSMRHRAIRIAGGRPDPGHRMLERVLVLTAAVAVVVFGVWFLLFAGASPVPLGISL